MLQVEPMSLEEASPSELRREPLDVDGAGGWRLRGEWLLPSVPRSVAVVGHAMMVDRRTLDRPRGRGLVSLLAARGIAVAWPDLRGHGQSGPRADEGGNWSYDDLVADVPPLLAAARARFPRLPLCTVGHSLFGHVVLAHLSRHPAEPLDGHVMLACNVANPTWRKRPLQRWQKGVGIELMYLLARLYGRAPIQRFRIGNHDEPLEYAHDFVRLWRRSAWLARDGFDYFAALPRVTTPVLALVGANDRLFSPPDDARDLVASLPHHQFDVVGRQSGLGFDPDHMQLVTDERCRPAWERVAAFVTAARGR